MSSFDKVIDRTNTSSTKWDRYSGRDILPFWVADMDFEAPDFILQAVRERLAHGVLGYTQPPQALNDGFLAWLKRTYLWSVDQSSLVWLPGVVPGLNLAARALAKPGGSILLPAPVYHPFLGLSKNSGQRAQCVPLVRDSSSGQWVMDFDALEHYVDDTTTMIAICNPQNPTGRVYTRQELTELADFCVRHDLVVLSDEIHCELILDRESRHIPIASLNPEIANRSITLYAATKTYNIAGLSCAVAVIPNPAIRRRFEAADSGLLSGIGPLSFAASQAAYLDTSPWLERLLTYLRNNHAAVLKAAGSRMNPVQATYLAWIDVSDLRLTNPASYFEEHGLGLSLGAQFGQDGHIRLNFGCPISLLEAGLARLERALEH
ncbi:MAG: PatB family C-S lyase [Proteobacteria bacterium]|nr:PatB family C-S lyase [Pseudomonadota bacterium]